MAHYTQLVPEGIRGDNKSSTLNALLTKLVELPPVLSQVERVLTNGQLSFTLRRNVASYDSNSPSDVAAMSARSAFLLARKDRTKHNINVLKEEPDNSKISIECWPLISDILGDENHKNSFLSHLRKISKPAFMAQVAMLDVLYSLYDENDDSSDVYDSFCLIMDNLQNLQIPVPEITWWGVMEDLQGPNPPITLFLRMWEHDAKLRVSRPTTEGHRNMIFRTNDLAAPPHYVTDFVKYDFFC